jgi:hypothetical protein
MTDENTLSRWNNLVERLNKNREENEFFKLKIGKEATDDFLFILSKKNVKEAEWLFTELEKLVIDFEVFANDVRNKKHGKI